MRIFIRVILIGDTKTLDRSYKILKRDNFHDFLFVFLYTKAFMTRDHSKTLSREHILSCLAKSFLKELPHLKVYSFTLGMVKTLLLIEGILYQLLSTLNGKNLLFRISGTFQRGLV